MAGQVARLLGARVVGSTSSDEKCAFLLEHGFDAAINYKTCGDYAATLATHFPNGIDGYFDCVVSDRLGYCRLLHRLYARHAMTPRIYGC